MELTAAVLRSTSGIDTVRLQIRTTLKDSINQCSFQTADIFSIKLSSATLTEPSSHLLSNADT